MSNMYKENRKSINAFVGCKHGCVYCRPSFQRQAKRQKKRCTKCYEYTPHFHPERLLKAPPKTRPGEFIFFPSMGDLAFADEDVVKAHIEYARKYSDRTFLVQTKNPIRFFGLYKWPENVILAVTAETDREVFETPSRYKTYGEISQAPLPCWRLCYFAAFHHPRKFITVEPILDFSPFFVRLIRLCKPEVVYVGYDNHGCRLPEPPLEKTQALIEELEKFTKFTEVRTKTLRPAWYEEASK